LVVLIGVVDVALSLYLGAISSDTASILILFAELRGSVRALEVGATAEEVRQSLEVVLERLRRARAKLMDLVSRGGPDGLGEVLGDLNKAISDLEGV
jgi:hypothetical protein